MKFENNQKTHCKPEYDYLIDLPFTGLVENI